MTRSVPHGDTQVSLTLHVSCVHEQQQFIQVAKKHERLQHTLSDTRSSVGPAGVCDCDFVIDHGQCHCCATTYLMRELTSVPIMVTQPMAVPALRVLYEKNCRTDARYDIKGEPVEQCIPPQQLGDISASLRNK
jgi:hypothetical protein